MPRYGEAGNKNRTKKSLVKFIKDEENSDFQKQVRMSSGKQLEPSIISLGYYCSKMFDNKNWQPKYGSYFYDFINFLK